MSSSTGGSEPRIFHYSEGTSHKFWSITVEGTRQTVRFGRIATEGQTQTKEFADEAEARAASEKLILEKQKKGYREVAPDAAAQVPGKRISPRRPVQQLLLPL